MFPSIGETLPLFNYPPHYSAQHNAFFRASGGDGGVDAGGEEEDVRRVMMENLSRGKISLSLSLSPSAVFVFFPNDLPPPPLLH